MLLMRPILDYLHEYTSVDRIPARARVRVFVPVDQEAEATPGALVIFSEPARHDYGGPFVTNNIALLAGEVVFRRALPATRTLVIEHRPPRAHEDARDPESFDLVTFKRTNPKPALCLSYWRLELGEPVREPLIRRQVEDLIGRKLED